MPWKVAVQIRTVCACVYVCVCAHTCVYTHIGKQFRERFTDAPESRAVLPTLGPSLEKLLRLAGREHYLPFPRAQLFLPPASKQASLTLCLGFSGQLPAWDISTATVMSDEEIEAQNSETCPNHHRPLTLHGPSELPTPCLCLQPQSLPWV